MTAVVVDASVWVSALVGTEQFSGSSRAWLDSWRQDGHGFVGPVSFLVEVGCAVGRTPHEAQRARAAVANILSDPSFDLVTIDQALAQLAADLGIIAGLRGADALYAAVAKQRQIALVTWDNELLACADDVGIITRRPA